MKYVEKYKKGYIRVRGHWRRYRNGIPLPNDKRVWIATHLRKEVNKTK